LDLIERLTQCILPGGTPGVVCVAFLRVRQIGAVSHMTLGIVSPISTIKVVMPCYVALLRGVSPMDCSVPDLKRSLADVKTFLSSGNGGGAHATGSGVEENIRGRR
jgi:hypothetical protein